MKIDPKNVDKLNEVSNYQKLKKSIKNLSNKPNPNKDKIRFVRRDKWDINQ